MGIYDNNYHISLVDYFLNFLINSFSLYYYMPIHLHHFSLHFYIVFLKYMSTFLFLFAIYFFINDSMYCFSDSSKSVVTLFPSSSSKCPSRSKKYDAFLQFSFHHTYKYHILPFQNHFH